MSATEYEGGSQRFSSTTDPDSKGHVASVALYLAESKTERIKGALGKGREVDLFDYQLTTWYFDYARQDIARVANPRYRKELRTRMRRSVVKTARELPEFRRALKLEQISYKASSR